MHYAWVSFQKKIQTFYFFRDFSWFLVKVMIIREGFIRLTSLRRPASLLLPLDSSRTHHFSEKAIQINAVGRKVWIFTCLNSSSEIHDPAIKFRWCLSSYKKFTCLNFEAVKGFTSRFAFVKFQEIMLHCIRRHQHPNARPRLSCSHIGAECERCCAKRTDG